MPLGKILGYYSLLLLLCSVAFGGWTPPPAEAMNALTEQGLGDIGLPATGYYAHRLARHHTPWIARKS